MDSSLRILYAAGPGDVIGTYRHWKAGRDDPAQVAVTYSGQFYDLCKELGASGYVISTNRRRERIVEDNLIIEHRPMRFAKGPMPLYHLGQMWYGLRLAMSAWRFGADAVFVADGTTHWFMLALVRLTGARVVPSLHSMLWPKHLGTRGAVNRIILLLNSQFFRRGAHAVLSISDDVSQQVRSMLDGRALAIIPFLPTYRPESFGEGFPIPSTRSPFRVFFAGRIEQNKGVFDLLEIARQFKAEGRTDIEFDLCGDGSQLETLRSAARDGGLEANFHCHGQSSKPFMRQMYASSHVIIVPTTTAEGFNKVVAEGILAGRAVITSSICPALEYVREGVLEVPPNDRGAYAAAIVKLKEDAALYEAKWRGCCAVRGQFYDVSLGWKAAAKSAVSLK
jgi:glycosyltransferase involved in cell wall biosynthesis